MYRVLVIRKLNYMEVRHLRWMVANWHITIGGNSYEKVKTTKCLAPSLANKILFRRK